MPGLFGVVRVSAQSAPPEHLSEIFGRMAGLLAHTEEDLIQRWSAPDHLLIGRVGASHLHHVPWPAQADSGDLPRSFVAGVLHDGNVTAQGNRDAPPALNPSTMRGFYCLAQYDPPRRFLLAADRCASFPLYYAQVGGLLLFAPEVRALLALPALQPDLDLGAAATLVSCGHLLGDQTLVSTVRRLRGGEALVVEDGECDRRVYWRFAPGSRSGGESDLELEVELGRLVRASTRRHLGDPEKTAIFLSGGADSRGILGAALEAVGGEGELLHTVSWGVSEGRPDSDVSIAGRIARATNVNHRFLPRSTDEYGRHFLRANALIGSASDVAAYHPLEYTFMEDLRSSGFERALRGDETFGWLAPAHTIAEALKKVKLHRIGDDRHLRDFIRVEHYDELRTASEAVFANAAEEVSGSEPNDALDILYFTHRLQGYLNTASYYKLCWLDQRNILLDDEILDFVELIPARLRADKLLYRRAMARAFPQLWQLPFATADNLERWSVVLAESRPVREFVKESLEDERSQIWEFFDRRALVSLFGSTSPESLQSSAATRSRSWLRTTLLRLPDPVVAGLRGWRAAHLPLRLPAHAVLFRILVLKQFVDDLATRDA